jgi:peroxiredoxin (alkyl hydroperoxide reductase subunit C)
MLFNYPQLPQIGDVAPYFEVQTQKGIVRFPEFTKGSWCIFFAHPANFTSAWRMYSNFLAMKERWLHERNTKLLVLSNEAIRQNDWSDIVRRYIGIFLKAPVIEDRDNHIATLYGMSSGRRITPPYHRLLYIIDPEGIIRLILHRPLESIQTALADLEVELERLQGTVQGTSDLPTRPPEGMLSTSEQSDVRDGYKPKPAYFLPGKISLN